MNWFMFIVFVVMPIISVILALRAWHLTRTGTRLQAKIIRYERQETNMAAHTLSGDHRPKYRAVVGFADENGKMQSVKLPNVYSSELVAVGHSIEIIYPRGIPQKAQSAALSSIWLFPFWFCAPAVTIIVFIGLHLIWYRYVG